MKMSFTFDPQRIIKEGYMVKSPPLEERSLIRKRWRLRWFVLCYISDKPVLFYFTDEKHRKQLKSPKGQLSLVNVEVYKQRCGVHGYPYVINVRTSGRLFHLCQTQRCVHEDWAEKIIEHHVPNTEFVRQTQSTKTCQKGILRPSIESDKTLCEKKNKRVSIDESVQDVQPERNSDPPHYIIDSTNNNDIERRERSLTNLEDSNPGPLHISGVQTLGRPRMVKDGRERILPYQFSLPVVSTGPLSLERSHTCTSSYARESEENDDYVAMENIDRRTITIVEESEDEGIGRSDSESSGTSSISCSYTTNLLQKALKSSLGSNESNLLGSGFVGPKLTSTTKKKTVMLVTRSLGDLSQI